jgi:uncharacterized membrane protein YhaH (DUF805 family)
MEWFLKALQNFGDFDGRARRKEYWMYQLFVAIISMILATIITFIPALGILRILLSLVLFVPGLSLSIRRLHDIDKSGWWLFIIFVPLIGQIWFFILTVTEGTSGSNQFGSDPKAYQ